MGLSATQYNMFFSFYFLPNVIMPLFTGYLADLFGRKTGLLFCATMITLGHFFFAFGVSSRSFVLSVLGRFIFGIGAESYQAVTIEILTFWNIEFVSFSLAVQSAAEGLGSGLNNFLMPQLYSITANLPMNFWIGLAFAVLCLFSSFTFGLIESYTANRRPQSQETKNIKLSGIFNFPSLFWLLTLHVCFFDTNTSSFCAIAGGMSQTRFGFDVEESGILIVNHDITK